MNKRTRKQSIQELFESLHAVRRKFLYGQTQPKHGGLTHTQLMLLCVISRHQRMSVKSIAKAFHITSGAVTQLLDSLIKHGYVVSQSNPRDRRGVHLTLSRPASQALNKMKKNHLEKLVTLFAILSDAELEEYIRLNKKIFYSFSREKL